MNYQPPCALGLLFGAVLTLWALSIAALLINFAVASDFNIAAVLAVTGAVALLDPQVHGQVSPVSSICPKGDDGGH